MLIQHDRYAVREDWQDQCKLFVNLYVNQVGKPFNTWRGANRTALELKTLYRNAGRESSAFINYRS